MTINLRLRLTPPERPMRRTTTLHSRPKARCSGVIASAPWFALKRTGVRRTWLAVRSPAATATGGPVNRCVIAKGQSNDQPDPIDGVVTVLSCADEDGRTHSRTVNVTVVPFWADC